VSLWNEQAAAIMSRDSMGVQPEDLLVEEVFVNLMDFVQEKGILLDELSVRWDDLGRETIARAKGGGGPRKLIQYFLDMDASFVEGPIVVDGSSQMQELSMVVDIH